MVAGRSFDPGGAAPGHGTGAGAREGAVRV